jgi:CheY-like chemotaxis protein
MISPVLMRALEQDDFAFDSSLPGSEALGLAAARNLVIALGGCVQASAASSTGTRITVIIPVAAESVALKPLQPGQERSPSANSFLRILVAEDSEDSFQLFKAYLKGEPHTITRAVNGAEAVQLATAEAFDIVFMDIRMPVMDGYDATRQIREWETGKDRARMPIVVLSAEDLRTQRRQGALAGCSGHLLKPLRKDQLLEAIKTYSMPQSLSSMPFSSISVPSH